MKRVAFTIIYNGFHHLIHNDYASKLCQMFDYWAVVEGSSGNSGSTSWCKNLERSINSTDGTISYLKKLQEKYPNICLRTADRQWNSKDEQVNVALNLLYEKIGDESCFLWEIDADEQWTKEDLIENERVLLESNKTCGTIVFNHFVSHDLIAVGAWGSGQNYRVWIWKNPSKQRFISHEPPRLSNTSDSVPLPKKCNHYSYVFEQDVKFKSEWYGGHENVYKNWKKLQNSEERNKLTFPLHVNFLFENYRYDGQIIKIN